MFEVLRLSLVQIWLCFWLWKRVRPSSRFWRKKLYPSLYKLISTMWEFADFFLRTHPPLEFLIFFQFLAYPLEFFWCKFSKPSQFPVWTFPGRCWPWASQKHHNLMLTWADMCPLQFNKCSYHLFIKNM